MQKKSILIITTKNLFPPEDGRADTVSKRLKILSNFPEYEITILNIQKKISKNYCPYPFIFINIIYKLNPFQVIKGLCKGLPFQVSIYFGKLLNNQIKDALKGLQFDILITDMARTAFIGLSIKAKYRILDLDDLLSERYKLQLSSKTKISLGKIPFYCPNILQDIFARLILRYEAFSLAAFEKKVVDNFDLTLLVSDEEVAKLQKRINTKKKVIPLHNYIQIEANLPLKRKDNTIVFFGNLSTAHNVDTALWILESIFPAIKKQVEDAVFILAGKSVNPSILIYKDKPGIQIMQDVPDLFELIADATLCLTPFRFGSGIKTKILEAMALKIPVITNQIGAEGIPDAENCLYICDTEKDMINRAINILNGTENLNKIGKAYDIVVSKFSYQVVAEKLISIL